MWADGSHVTSGLEQLTAVGEALVCSSPAITACDVPDGEARLSESLKTYNGQVA